MLEPRDTNIPALFLVLVVLPLVLYILLGKWGEAAKKRERVSLLAHLAVKETVQSEGMAAATVMPQVASSINEDIVLPLFSSSKNGRHICARCFSLAKTRCSRCKSVRYCSGNCQIIHWRQVHKHECYQLETSKSSSSGESDHGRVLLNDTTSPEVFGYSTAMQNPPSDDTFNSTSSLSSDLAKRSTIVTSQVIMQNKKTNDKWGNCSNTDQVPREDLGFSGTSKEATATVDTHRNYTDVVSAGSKGNMLLEKESSKKLSADSSNRYIYGQSTTETTVNESQFHQTRNGMVVEQRSNFGYLNPPYTVKTGMNVHAVKTNVVAEGVDCLKVDNGFHNETSGSSCSETAAKKGSFQAKAGSHHHGTKTIKVPEPIIHIPRKPFLDGDMKDYVLNESKSKGTGANGKHSAESVRTMGLKKPRGARCGEKEIDGDKCRKMLFPYEEFVKYFQYEVHGISPRGLLNCGNSCYANAVLQCLTCTKPLILYLLHRSHSRTCCGKDWCLMCELEEHAMMLRESGGPLSPSRILFHIRNINCQLGNGSQEDAHEFLRLLIASMQSICLERLGGESRVDPRLQETTFIQHTFGGRLLSKVQCLRCHHESERYENIMDLTLEIFGWVESLEDALTQFTSPEDLDGENMYRCGRCATYVRARKQLSIHEAPNILTIVLKRFQEGKYGKINKCITFPDILDMIPFMTGISDIPPLYSLYGVVVHLDTSNASFSGHYVSYVKDLQGSWFRIDDTEVQPVSISQVMSKGAYILFYMRSWPRPQGKFSVTNMQQSLKTEKPSRSRQSQQYVAPEPSSDLWPETMKDFSRKSHCSFRSANRNVFPHIETFAEPAGIELVDPTQSDWSIFTSSDEASFTTESTRDSFSTVDYTDACNTDPLSIFSNLYGQDYPGYRTVPCRKYSSSRAETRFISEVKGYVLDSYVPTDSLGRAQKVKGVNKSGDSSTDVYCERNCSTFQNHGSKHKYGTCRTFGSCRH